MKNLHTQKAEQRIEEVKQFNKELKAQINALGYAAIIGAERYNKRKVFLYKQATEVGQRPSSKKAVHVAEYFYKGNNFFCSEVKQIDNENDALRECLREIT